MENEDRIVGLLEMVVLTLDAALCREFHKEFEKILLAKATSMPAASIWKDSGKSAASGA